MGEAAVIFDGASGRETPKPPRFVDVLPRVSFLPVKGSDVLKELGDECLCWQQKPETGCAILASAAGQI
jgi:hypothetical protein